MNKQQLAQWISEWLMGPNGPSFSRVNIEGKEITVDGEIDLQSLVDYIIEKCVPSVSLDLSGIAGPEKSDTHVLATLQSLDNFLSEDYAALNPEDAKMLVNTEAELAVDEFRSLGYHFTGVLFKLYADEFDGRCKLSKETYDKIPRLRFFGPYSAGVNPATLLRAYADMFEMSERSGSMVRSQLGEDGQEIPISPVSGEPEQAAVSSASESAAPIEVKKETIQ